MQQPTGEIEVSTQVTVRAWRGIKPSSYPRPARQGVLCADQVPYLGRRPLSSNPRQAGAVDTSAFR